MTHAMQPQAEGTAATASAHSWRGWWALAGVNEVVTDQPHGWLAVPPSDPVVPARPVAAAVAIPPDNWAAMPDLASLVARVRAEWPACPIGDGNPDSGIVIVGEAPSAEDLRTGRPFTGPAGQLLDRMLTAIGLDRASAYITLLAPRRRIAGAAPPEAIAADRGLTAAHLRLLRPRALLLLGQAASIEIGGATGTISRSRGTWLMAPGLDAPALPTFNPAYLLRRPADKALAWADLLAFKRRIST